MIRQDIQYECSGIKLKGYLVHNEIVEEPRPCIILAHAWMGLDPFIKDKADLLARLGYVAFCADLYGGGKSVQTNEEAYRLMLPLFKDRELLRQRIRAAFSTVQKVQVVDNKQIGAIGYCFGGLTVLELLRSGEDVSAVVSFHGLLGDTIGEEKAELSPTNHSKGKALILHGHKDPLVSQNDINQIKEEFTSLGIDWQLVIYGSAYHAFTNPSANDPESGLCYNASAAERSWRAMQNLFQETFH